MTALWRVCLVVLLAICVVTSADQGEFKVFLIGYPHTGAHLIPNLLAELGFHGGVYVEPVAMWTLREQVARVNDTRSYASWATPKEQKELQDPTPGAYWQVVLLANPTQFEHFHQAFPHARFVLTVSDSTLWLKHLERELEAFAVGCALEGTQYLRSAECLPVRLAAQHLALYGQHPIPHSDSDSDSGLNYERSLNLHRTGVSLHFGPALDAEEGRELFALLTSHASAPRLVVVDMSQQIAAGGDLAESKAQVPLPLPSQWRARCGVDPQQQQQQQQLTLGATRDSPLAVPRHAAATVAYVLFVAHPSQPAERDFFLGALVAARSLQRTHTTADIVLMVYGEERLSVQDAGLVHAMNVKVEFVPFDVGVAIPNDPSVGSDERTRSVYRAHLHALALTQYTKIISLDSDIVVRDNMDAFFATTETASFFIKAGYAAPINSGFYVATPSCQDWLDVLDVARSGVWDVASGWLGYGPIPNWLPHRRGESRDWNFHSSTSDQGLLYFYYGLVRVRVSLRPDASAEGSSARDDRMFNLLNVPRRSLNVTILPLTNPHHKRQRQGLDPDDYMVHFLGKRKPWLVARDQYKSHLEHLEAGARLWYELLDELRVYAIASGLDVDLRLGYERSAPQRSRGRERTHPPRGNLAPPHTPDSNSFMLKMGGAHNRIVDDVYMSCTVGTWSAWGSCSAPCGGGTHTRTRPILHQGDLCPPTTETLPCNILPCKCEVSDWSAWSNCSASCGGGTKTRTRSITQSGPLCPPTTESFKCNILPCECKLSSWSSWSNCSVECDGGTQTRTRTITSDPGGAQCPPTTASRACNTKSCDLFKCYMLNETCVCENRYSNATSPTHQTKTVNVTGGCAATKWPFTVDPAWGWDDECNKWGDCYGTCNKAKVDCDKQLDQDLLGACKNASLSHAQYLACMNATKEASKAVRTPTEYASWALEQSELCDCDDHHNLSYWARTVKDTGPAGWEVEFGNGDSEVAGNVLSALPLLIDSAAGDWREPPHDGDGPSSDARCKILCDPVRCDGLCGQHEHDGPSRGSSHCEDCLNLLRKSCDRCLQQLQPMPPSDQPGEGPS